MRTKILKSIILFALMTVLCVGMVMTAGATSESDFTYKVVTENGTETATITGYTGNGGVVFIPESIDGYTVTAIDSLAFSTHDLGSDKLMPASKITTIILPATIKTIGEGAFLRQNYSYRTCSLLGIGFKKIGDLTVFICSSIETVDPLAFTNIEFRFSTETAVNAKHNIIFSGTEEQWNKAFIYEAYREEYKESVDSSTAIISTAYNDTNTTTFSDFENCNHEWSFSNRINEKGCEYTEVYTCNSCGYFKTEFVDNHGWFESSDSYYNCEGGAIYYYCDGCGANKVVTIEPKEHNWKTAYYNEYQEYYNYNCEEGFIRHLYCTNCRTTKDETVEPKEHDWYIEDTYSYRCEDGAYYKCHDCNANKSEIINDKHHWVIGDCEEGGDSQWCTNCYDYKNEWVEPSEHDTYTTIGEDATCTDDAIEYTCCRKCYYDGSESNGGPLSTRPIEGTALGHDFSGEPILSLPATCTDRGFQIMDCTRCSEICLEELPKTAHEDSDGDNMCDGCLASLTGATDPDDGNTSDQPSTPDDNDTPDIPENNEIKEEENIFSFLTELIKTLVDFFKLIFGMA